MKAIYLLCRSLVLKQRKYRWAVSMNVSIILDEAVAELTTVW